MNTLTGILALTSLCATVALSALAARGRRLARLTHEVVEQAAQDSFLAGWTRRTELNVVASTGYVYTVSLDELAGDSRGSDRTWSDPIMVSVWTTSPGESMAELKRELHAVPEGDDG